MKKVLVGCLVVSGLGMAILGGLGFMGWKVVNNMTGDFQAALPLAVQTPLDRLEQDAEPIKAGDLGAKIGLLSGRSVRVTGRVTTPGEAGLTQPPPGMDQGGVFIMEPAVMVMPVMDAVTAHPPQGGDEVTVLGIATRINMAGIPGMDETARQNLVKSLGSLDLPVVVARKIDIKRAPVGTDKPRPLDPAPNPAPVNVPPPTAPTYPVTPPSTGGTTTTP